MGIEQFRERLAELDNQINGVTETIEDENMHWEDDEIDSFKTLLEEVQEKITDIQIKFNWI